MSDAGGSPWVRPTTGFWQQIEAATDWQQRLAPPYQYAFPARLPDGQVLALPIRPLAGRPGHAVASLIANQASFEVIDRLVADMAALARPLAVECLVGLPTLGMVFAGPVARLLGQSRWVPMGYSRKFWYDESLSTLVSSITTPGPGKRVFLDPNQLPLVAGRSVLIVDDAVSSGATLSQVWTLLEALGARVAGALVAMRQGRAWHDALGADRSARVQGVFDSPRLVLRGDGWWPE